MHETWKAEPSALLEPYKRRCFVLGRRVEVSPVTGGVFTAQAEDISDDFGLVLRLPDGGLRTAHSGEVRILVKEER